MLIMFYWVVKNSKFSAGKWRFDQTDSTVLLLWQRAMYFFVDLLQIKDKFHCQESIIIHRVSAYERA